MKLFKLLLLISLLLIPTIALSSEDCTSNDADGCIVTCDGTDDHLDIQQAITDSASENIITLDASGSGGICDMGATVANTDKTITIDGTSAASTTINFTFAGGGRGFDFDHGSTFSTTFRNITFTDGTSGHNYIFWFDGDYAARAAWYVHDCIFTDLSKKLLTSVIVYGLFEDNVCTGDQSNACYMFLQGEDATEWARDNDFGTVRAVYLENNTIGSASDEGYLIDGDRGARVVVRYNDITNYEVSSHGYYDTSTNRGFMLYEVYENTFTAHTSALSKNPLQARSGTGVFYNNTVTTANGGTWLNGHAILFKPYNACPDISACTVRSNNSENPRDVVYPITDQPGRGSNQTLTPFYIWNNGSLSINLYSAYTCDDWTITSSVDRTSDSTCADGTDAIAALVIEDYDYYYSTDSTDAMPGYTPYTYPHPLTGDIATNPLSYSSTGPSIIYNSGGLSLISE